MAYTAPRTWTTGATGTLLNASSLNTDIRDNVASLRGLNDASASVYLADNQTIANTTETAIIWSASNWNIGSMWNSGLNPTRITVPVAGYYAITTHVGIQVGDTGYRRLAFRVNGTTHYRACIKMQTGDNSCKLFAYEELLLAATDYVEVLIFHNQGASLDLDAGPLATTCTVTLLGDANGTTWTQPTTWALGSSMTAAGLNTYLKNNVNTLRGQNSFTCRLQFSATATITNADTISLAWTTAAWNIGSMWDSAVSASEVKPPVVGWYGVWARVEWDDNSSGYRSIGYNAGATDYEMVAHNAVSGTGTAMCFWDDWYCSATTQRIRFTVYQDRGANLGLKAGSTGTVAGVRLLGTSA